jgi:hypothetical protein
VGINGSGKMVISSTDLFRDYVLQGLDGLIGFRIRSCPVCGHLYYAKPLHKSGCSMNCCHVERTRRLRDPAKRREYERNRRINRRVRQGRSIGAAWKDLNEREKTE